MTSLKLSESEYRFCQLLWREGAMEWEALLDLAQKELGWSRATAARQLRRLIRGGAVQRSGETVTALGNWEATAQGVRFYFSSYDGDGDGFGLNFVAIYYASDADQAAILSALRQTYGTEPETYPALDSLTLDMTTGVQEPGVIHWVSETTRGDLLTEEGRALYRAEQSSNMQEQLTDAQFENLLATPAGGVVWRENLYADEWIAEAMPDLPAVPYVGIEGGFVSYAAQRCNGAP